MHWHSEQTLRLDVRLGPDDLVQYLKLTLRGYEQPDGFAMRLPFLAVAQADLLLTERRAFIHGMLTRSGLALSRSDWRSLGAHLRSAHGVRSVVADRHGRRVTYNASFLQG